MICSGEERHTQRNRHIFWIVVLHYFCQETYCDLSCLHKAGSSMAFIEHMRVSDTYFPEHILVILRHTCLGAIWQSQDALELTFLT